MRPFAWFEPFRCRHSSDIGHKEVRESPGRCDRLDNENEADRRRRL